MVAHSTSSNVQTAVKPLQIGSVVIDPPILQAPMAGFTNFAFRQIVREYGGAGLQATEMVNARGFVWMDLNVAEHPDRLWGVKDEARPLAVQIWDNDPDMLAKVGDRLAHEYQVSIVDINFGCPVKQVTQKAHSGSYLLSHPDRMGAIIERVVAKPARPTPVTAKIRLGCTRKKINAIDIAQVVEGAGAAALTVHGRTAEDFFRGNADWARIAEIKSHLKQIPLIGNGDLDSAAKVVEAFRRYEVNGVMIARACLGRPWLFMQAAAALRGEPVPVRPDARRAARVYVATLRSGRETLRYSKGHAVNAQVRLLLRPRQARRETLPLRMSPKSRRRKSFIESSTSTSRANRSERESFTVAERSPRSIRGANHGSASSRSARATLQAIAS